MEPPSEPNQEKDKQEVDRKYLLESISKHFLFKDVSANWLVKLAESAIHKDYAEREEIYGFHKEVPGLCLLIDGGIVVGGVVKPKRKRAVSQEKDKGKDDDTGFRPVRNFMAPDFFGEVEMMTQTKSILRAVATAGGEYNITAVVTIPFHVVEDLMDNNARFTKQLFKVSCQRMTLLADGRWRLATSKKMDVAAALYDMITLKQLPTQYISHSIRRISLSVEELADQVPGSRSTAYRCIAELKSERIRDGRSVKIISSDGRPGVLVDINLLREYKDGAW